MTTPEHEKAFRELVAQLDYPMHIVTAATDDDAGGCLVGFATQVSIHPPRYLVGISKKNHTHGLVERADGVVVHLPSPDERAVADLFGEETADEVDKLARCSWRPGPDGRTPVLDGCDRWFAATIIDRIDLGDHLGLLLDPTAADPGPGAPQLGFQAVQDMEPGHDA